MGLVHPLMEYSPLAFAGPGLEQAYQRQRRPYTGVFITYQMQVTMIFVGLLSFRTWQKREAEEALVVALSLAASTVVCIISLVLRHWAPLAFERNQEVVPSPS